MYFYDKSDALQLAAEWASQGYPAQVLPRDKPVWQVNSPSHPNAHGWQVVHL